MVLEFTGGAVPVELALLSPDGGEIGAQKTGAKAEFSVPAPKRWTAETPALYTRLMEANGEHIMQKVGIRSIRVKQGVVLLNGVPIKLRGVNRHDSDPATGFTISREQLLRDFRLM